MKAAVIALAYIGAGALWGALQWLVLRRGIRRAGWWLLANPAGLALGFYATRALDGVLGIVRVPVSETAGLVVLFGAMSGTAAIVTGAVLIWLLSLTLPDHRTMNVRE